MGLHGRRRGTCVARPRHAQVLMLVCGSRSVEALARRAGGIGTGDFLGLHERWARVLGVSPNGLAVNTRFCTSCFTTSSFTIGSTTFNVSGRKAGKPPASATGGSGGG